MDSIKSVPYPVLMCSRLARLRLVDTAEIRGELCVRITIDGRHALTTGEYTSRDRDIAVRIRREVLDGLKEVAGEVGVEDMNMLLRTILLRREAFVRWFKFINAEELSNE